MISAGEAVAYLTMDYSGYSKGLKSAGQELNTFLDSNNSAGTRINALGNSMVSVGKTLTKGVTMPILGVGTAITMMSANFEEGLSKVEAISGASTKEMELLTAKAKEMGSSTKFSATEAASAFEYMAMAGWQTEDMLNGIEGIMNLAAASGEDLALVSDICTDALTAFGLSAKESAHFADVLAQASNASNTNVAMLGESFKYVAPVAGALGYTVEDTSIALGLMANAGIKAGNAGTALRAALSQMLKPSDPVLTAMKQLDISLTEADGSSKSLSKVMLMLRERFGGLTEAQKAEYAATIFGTEAMSGMLAIINASEGDYNKLTNAINNADGTAKNMAKTMQDNLKGQLTTIKSKIEGAAISLGETLVPMLGKAVDKLEDAVDWFNSLDEATQENIVKWGALAATIGPALVVGGKAINGGVALVRTIGSVTSGIGSLISATTGLGSATTVAANGGIAKATVGIAGLGPAGAVAVGAIAAVGVALYANHELTDLYSDSILKATEDMSLMEKGLGNLTGATMYSKEELVKLGYVYDDWSSEVSKNTQTVLEDVSDKSRDIQFAINTVRFDGIITNEDVATVSTKTDEWCNAIITAIEGNQTEINSTVEELFNIDGIITESEQQILDIYTAYKSEHIKVAEESNTKIKEIMQTAADENRDLTERENNTIIALQRHANKAMLDSMNISHDERIAAQNLFLEKASTYSAEALSKSLVEEKAIIEEKKKVVREQYDDGIKALEATIPLLKGIDKIRMQEELDSKIQERDLLLQNENDKWSDIVNACEDGYSDYMSKINKYTGEELSKGDMKVKKVFEQTKSQYDGMNQITEDGMYTLKNTITGEWENVVIKTDEATGDIVGMCKIVADEYGIRTGEVVGYTKEYMDAVSKEGYEAIATRNLIIQALQDQTNTTVDWKNNCIRYNDQVIAKFQEVKQNADGTRTGIINLNGTGVEVKVNKDGTVADLQQIIDKLLQINSKTVTVTTNYVDRGGNTHSAYATGTYSAMSGMALVGENGPEMINLGRGGQRIYNNSETERIIGSMQSGEKVSNENYNSNLITQLANELKSITTKLNEVLNSEGTIELTSNLNIHDDVIGRVITPIVSNKLAVASMSNKRRG